MTDSQLSAAVRAGKLNYSQDRNKTEDSEEWSQNTKKMISNGSYVLPGLSQGGIDLLEADIQGMEGVRLEIESKHNFSAEILAKSASFTVPKRRTDRIELTHGESPDDSVFDPNKSLDIFSPPISPQDSLMNSSFNDSVMTVTQRQIDSQSPPIEILRHRTEEEQKMHKLQKEVQKAIKRTPREHPSRLLELPRLVTESLKEPETRGSPMNEHIFSDDEEGPQNNKEARFHVVKTEEMEPEVEDSLTIRVGAATSKKISEFVAYEMQNDERYLWAKMGARIPFRVEWKVSDASKRGNLKLRIRLIRYDKFLPIEKALRAAHADVKKCRYHTETDMNYPPESFFYVHSHDVNWIAATDLEKLRKGHSFSAELPTSKNELDMEVKFACQEKCMGIEERRKIMCLAVFLEDDVGNVIKHSLFKEVRVVAYPRRDYKNFQLKRSESNCAPEDWTTKRPSARLQEHEMYNCTNTPKMFPSTSFSRKRALKSESSPEIDVIGGNDYERKLMLGGSYRPPQLHEQMEVENREDVVSKRARPDDSFHAIYVEDDYERDLVLRVLAEKRLKDRARVNGLILPQRHPLSLQCSVTPDTRIDVWLNTLGPPGKERYVQLFDNFHIYCIQQLINRFEVDPQLFSKLGFEPADVKPIRHIFLNYYRVHKAEILKLPNSEELM